MDYSIEPPAATAQSVNDPKYDALAGALERTQNQLLALSERLSNPPQLAAPAAIDPFVMMERMSAIMKNMQPATVAASGGDLKTFIEAANFVDDLRGQAGGGDDGWSGIVKALITSPQAGEIVKTVMENRKPDDAAGAGMNGRRMLPGRRCSKSRAKYPYQNLPLAMIRKLWVISLSRICAILSARLQRIPTLDYMPNGFWIIQNRISLSR